MGLIEPTDLEFALYKLQNCNLSQEHKERICFVHQILPEETYRLTLTSGIFDYINSNKNVINLVDDFIVYVNDKKYKHKSLYDDLDDLDEL